MAFFLSLCFLVLSIQLSTPRQCLWENDRRRSVRFCRNVTGSPILVDGKLIKCEIFIFHYRSLHGEIKTNEIVRTMMSDVNADDSCADPTNHQLPRSVVLLWSPRHTHTTYSLLTDTKIIFISARLRDERYTILRHRQKKAYFVCSVIYNNWAVIHWMRVCRNKSVHTYNQ